MSICRYCGNPANVGFCSQECFDAHRDFMVDLEAEREDEDTAGPPNCLDCGMCDSCIDRSIDHDLEHEGMIDHDK